MSNNRYDAIIFDRDDTLTIDVNWTFRIDDFKFIDGAPSAVKFCNDLGVFVFVATNQGGIGKGLYSVRDMHRFHWYLKRELARHSAWIDDIAYCPHYPYKPYDERACSCRKPNPGLISMLCTKWDLVPSRVLMIGDKQTDVEAAEKAGAKGILFGNENLYELVTSQLAE